MNDQLPPSITPAGIMDRLLAIYPSLREAMSSEPVPRTAAQQGVFRPAPCAEETAAQGGSPGA
jgi:hypothetical protein